MPWSPQNSIYRSLLNELDKFLLNVHLVLATPFVSDNHPESNLTWECFYIVITESLIYHDRYCSPTSFYSCWLLQDSNPIILYICSTLNYIRMNYCGWVGTKDGLVGRGSTKICTACSFQLFFQWIICLFIRHNWASCQNEGFYWQNCFLVFSGCISSLWQIIRT